MVSSTPSRPGTNWPLIYSPEYQPYDPAHGSDAPEDEVVTRSRQRGEFRHVAIAEGARILDVGCGVGYFLRIAAQLGATIEGIEPSPVAAAQAPASGLPIFQGTVEDYVALRPDGAFDIITANHVLEHVSDPGEGAPGARIAVVQHGDYAEALRIIGSGQPEPYSGMADSVRVLEGLLGDHSHLVLSLNAPPYAIRRGSGELIGLPRPALPRGVPATAALLLWAARINRRLRRFRPTHVLLRTGGVVAWRVLEQCRRSGANTLVMFANYLKEEDVKGRWISRRLVALLNEPFVHRVGNHRPPAAQSLIDHGVRPEKVVAYDWPGQPCPDDHPPKSLSGPPYRLVFAGTLCAGKGVADLIDAVGELGTTGPTIRLDVFGDGPDAARLREQAHAYSPGTIEFAGRKSNEDVFRAMLAADVVCVPSRHDYTEGMPFVLTEALASRTPVIASDHPVFVRAFEDGRGVRIFRAGDSTALAAAIHSVLTDPLRYEELSRTTAEAHEATVCRTMFSEVVQDWITAPRIGAQGGL
jgi:glycosyltransferase involved in cell wall biosynthesis